MQYIYTLQHENRACSDLTAAGLQKLDLDEWQAAIDLPNGTDFARGYDANGKPVMVYRELLA